MQPPVTHRRIPIRNGRVYIRELLDLTGATDSKAALQDEIRHLYDWHNSRALAGMQLTFAPAAAAILAIVTKPDSTAVLIAGTAVVLIMLALGVAQLLALNWHHGEYVFAIRLAVELHRLHEELADYPHGIDPRPSVAEPRAGRDEHPLYWSIGWVSMVDYAAHHRNRQYVLSNLAELPGEIPEIGTSPAANG